MPDSETTGQDSPVIGELRRQIRDLKAEVKGLQADLANAVDTARREIAFEDAYEATGLPESVQGLVAAELDPNQPITAERIGEIVEGLGLGGALRVPEPEVEVVSSEAVTGSQIASSVAEVADLGRSVAQAASGSLRDNLTDRINSAETPAELANIMNEAGL